MSFEYPCIATNAVCTREKHRKTSNGNNTHIWSKQRKIATQFIKCQIEKKSQKKKTKSFRIKVKRVNYTCVNKYYTVYITDEHRYSTTDCEFSSANRNFKQFKTHSKEEIIKWAMILNSLSKIS